jgi:hypothetical protein
MYFLGNDFLFVLFSVFLFFGIFLAVENSRKLELEGAQKSKYFLGYSLKVLSPHCALILLVYALVPYCGLSTVADFIVYSPQVFASRLSRLEMKKIIRSPASQEYFEILPYYQNRFGFEKDDLIPLLALSKNESDQVFMVNTFLKSSLVDRDLFLELLDKYPSSLQAFLKHPPLKELAPSEIGQLLLSPSAVANQLGLIWIRYVYDPKFGSLLLNRGESFLKKGLYREYSQSVFIYENIFRQQLLGKLETFDFCVRKMLLKSGLYTEKLDYVEGEKWVDPQALSKNQIELLQDIFEHYPPLKKFEVRPYRPFSLSIFSEKFCL